MNELSDRMLAKYRKRYVNHLLERIEDADSMTLSSLCNRIERLIGVTEPARPAVLEETPET